MAATLKLEIVTPSAKIFSEDVEMVTLTGIDGEMGILPEHMALMTQLASGFIQVTREQVSILTDMAIKADDIDEAKAEEARQKAEARLSQKLSDEETVSVQASLMHALTQLNVKRRRHL
jgi:F-type H+-transporting ATPase subunit epsilon